MNRRCSKSESKLNDIAHDKKKDNEIPINQTTALSDQMPFLNLSQTLTAKLPQSQTMRLRFHKASANSNSSSEASDDDNAENEDEDVALSITDHKPVKVFRRDSQDDSSDSQDACSGGGTSSTTGSKFYKTYFRSSANSDTNNNNNNNRNNNKEKKKSHLRISNVSEIQLNESLSLNRIAEVHEDVYLGRSIVSKKVLPISLSVHCYCGNDCDSCSCSTTKKGKGCRNAVRKINATFNGFFKYNFRKNTRDSSTTIVTYVDRRLNMLKKFQRDLFSKKLKSNVF